MLSIYLRRVKRHIHSRVRLCNVQVKSIGKPPKQSMLFLGGLPRESHKLSETMSRQEEQTKVEIFGHEAQQQIW